MGMTLNVKKTFGGQLLVEFHVRQPVNPYLNSHPCLLLLAQDVARVVGLTSCGDLGRTRRAYKCSDGLESS